jgi:hypothetical protein
MISGNTTRIVSRYLPIDRVGEGCGWATPKPGQKFVGIPYQWHADQSTPFIEVHNEQGVVIETINALDCHAIEFAEV